MLRLRVNVLPNRLILNVIFVILRYLVFFRITSMGIFLILEAVLIPDYCFRKIELQVVSNCNRTGFQNDQLQATTN